MDFNLELNNKLELINKKLDEYLEIKYPEIIYEAMRYSVFAGGKRLRPMLLLAACETVGGNIEKALPFACAMEMIHTYSLIHDDLPAMDNDDFRRGKKTCHKMFDEGIAILAGDCLLNYAFEIMFNAVAEGGNKNCIEAAKIISEFSGTKGMLVGQVVDVISEDKPVDEKTLMYIHNNKTGGLIKAALMAGALVGGANEQQVKIFEKIGYNMGIAFQIKDDILDVTSTTDVLGKPVFSDEKNNKTTYVTMFGLEKAQADYLALSEKTIEEINRFENCDFLREYAEKLVSRIN